MRHLRYIFVNNRNDTFNHFIEIDFAKLKLSIESNSVTVVDVRNRNEIEEAGKLPGSYVVPREFY